MFKVNIWCHYFITFNIFHTLFQCFSIVNFGHVIAGWVHNYGNFVPVITSQPVKGVATKSLQGDQTKIGTFSSNDFFICKTFTCVFLRNINSKQILLTCPNNQIPKLQQVEIDQPRKITYVLPTTKFRIIKKS